MHFPIKTVYILFQQRQTDRPGDVQTITGPYPGGGGSRWSDDPPPSPQPPYTSNYRVPPAHRFHKYKLRLLHFRMQLTPYSIKYIKKNSGGTCPQTLLSTLRRCPPPPPLGLSGWVCIPVGRGRWRTPA